MIVPVVFMSTTEDLVTLLVPWDMFRSKLKPKFKFPDLLVIKIPTRNLYVLVCSGFSLFLVV